MTLQQMKYAITVAECGSMNEAAHKLFITQPSLSSTIRELEKELGLTLFLRSNRGISLTQDGEEFLGYARQIIAQYGMLEERFIDRTARKTRFSVSTQHYSFAVKAFVDLTRSYDVAEYEFAIRETRTKQVIDDVISSRSEIGILYLGDFNRKVLTKMINGNGLEFHHLIDCNAYVYLWKGHPLAEREAIAFEDLAPYPCLSFEQGEESNFYLAEEILATNDYPRIIKCCDRATMLNLMVGLNGYTLCSGIICEELNGSDYIAVPYQADEENPNSLMEIGYITKKNSILSRMCEQYIEELKRYLKV